MDGQLPIDEHIIELIKKYLFQQHLANEPQWLVLTLAAPIIALLFFIILWAKYKAHVHDLVDAVFFFFIPYAPKRMLLLKDHLGNKHVFYDDEIKVAGGKDGGFIVQAGSFLVKLNDDPFAYAEPLSLIDTKIPGGPSPFGLFVRQLVAVYIMLALIALSFANTIVVTMAGFGMPPTPIDLVVFSALVFSLAWLLAILVKAFSPQTLFTSIVVSHSENNIMRGIIPVDAFSSIPPTKLLSKLTKIEINVADSVKEAYEKIKNIVGDSGLAAAILSTIGEVYETCHKSLGLILKSRYDISVAAKARYMLEREKIGPSWLTRYAGVIAILALIAIAVLAALLLNIQVQPAQVINETTNTITYVTPAQPPPPPISG
ncbi:hypothetical protein J4526_01805 [Desulfurococcaceae archaeon MEX13E-LK6-19]|nr:hypothetical protein J4526_01805 [Desulfurococcaceae archaeon MEX13E-LK6-19]